MGAFDVTNIKVEASLFLIISLSLVLLLVLAYVQGYDLSHVSTYLKLLPEIAFIDAVLITLFTRWGWKLKVFRGWLVPFPDLSGTWLGEIQSHWEREPGKSLPPIPAMLTISQSFLHVSCVLQTEEMQSRSYAEGVIFDHERQLRRLAYMYTSTPKVALADRSTPHDGAVVLDLIKVGNQSQLKGRYWTERRTTGELRFEFSSSDLLSALPSDFPAHPMTSGQGPGAAAGN